MIVGDNILMEILFNLFANKTHIITEHIVLQQTLACVAGQRGIDDYQYYYYHYTGND